MIAAAARTSGTRSPLASTLKRGRTVSAISRAVATARARARRALRDCDRVAEYTGGRGRAASLAAADFVAFPRDRVAATPSVGARPILTRPTSARRPNQKVALLFNWAAPNVWLMRLRTVV